MAKPLRTFASDNYAAVLPEIIEALVEEAHSKSHARAYGNDDVSSRARRLIQEVFSQPNSDHVPDVHFVFNGTGANILSVLACTQSYQAVICSEVSHIICDESSSAETVAGIRLISIPIDSSGKIRIDLIEEKMDKIGDMHAAQPKMITVAQPTEYGTVYTLDELQQLSAIAKKYNLYFHIDGSRFYNAATALKCDLRDLASGVGVDILSLGGTKIGLMYGEAVVVFNPKLTKSDVEGDNPLKYRHKQVMQLASKQRFIAAQFLALLEKELWKKSSEHSNKMAQLFKERLESVAKRTDPPLIRFTRPVETNVIFLEIPHQWYEPLSEAFPFYKWRVKNCEVRLMCSFDTTEEDLDCFMEKIDELIKS